VKLKKRQELQIPWWNWRKGKEKNSNC